MARGHAVTGHGAQHKLYIPLWVRGRSRAAPRPPVRRREGRCARQWPKCDSCAAGRPCPPPAAPSTREVLGSEAGPRAPPGGRTEAQTKRAGLRGEVRGGSGSSRSGRSLGAGGAVRRAGWWGAPSGVPPTPRTQCGPPGHLPQPARQGTGPACGWSSMASYQARWSSYGGWEGSPRSAQSQRAGSVWAPPVQLSPQVLMASPRPARPTGPAPQTCLASYLAPGPHSLCSGCWAAGTFPQTTWPFTTGPLTTGPQSHVGPGTPAISLSIRAR